MKDHVRMEISGTDNAKAEVPIMEDAQTARTEGARTEAATLTGSRERVWLAPGLPRSMEPLLAGLGIELLAAEDQANATIRVDSVGSFALDARTGTSAGRLRIVRVGGDPNAAQPAQTDAPNTYHTNGTHDAHETNSTIEFEGSGVWAAASYIVSLAFELYPPLLTADAAMFAVIRAAARAGQVDSPILVTGETGTGKELLVRLIHATSARADGLSSVNCAALNDAALKREPGEAVRGAADAENRLDELCMASGTTLFLDQVSELTSASQTRVLHAVLRAGNYVAGAPGNSLLMDSLSGGSLPGHSLLRKIRPGARLVSATNRPLGPMVLKGRFKRELYDRLTVLTLAVPPLRARRADIELLAVSFLRLAAPYLGFTPGALSALGSYPFPGNVRELHNLVTRLAIMQRDGASHLIDAAEVLPELAGPAVSTSI